MLYDLAKVNRSKTLKPCNHADAKAVKTIHVHQRGGHFIQTDVLAGQLSGAEFASRNHLQHRAIAVRLHAVGAEHLKFVAITFDIGILGKA